MGLYWDQYFTFMISTKVSLAKSEKIISNLYKSLARLHLEYCVHFWSAYYSKDINKLSRIHRRITKMIPSLRNKPYGERLNELNLLSITKCR